MAQRYEVEAWVNPTAWDDETRAREVVDAILASGSDDEAEWVRIAGGDGAAQANADERARDRAEVFVADFLREYRDAEARLAEARTALHDRLRYGMRQGHTAYRLAQVTGLSQSMLAKIRRGWRR